MDLLRAKRYCNCSKKGIVLLFLSVSKFFRPFDAFLLFVSTAILTGRKSIGLSIYFNIFCFKLTLTNHEVVIYCLSWQTFPKNISLRYFTVAKTAFANRSPFLFLIDKQKAFICIIKTIKDFYFECRFLVSQKSFLPSV